MTDIARDWVAAHFPAHLSDFPDADEGRNHRQVALTDDAVYWEARASTAYGVHLNPAWRRQEAIASQAAELAEREAAARTCLNCRMPATPRRKGLCVTCYRYAARHDGRPRVPPRGQQ